MSQIIAKPRRLLGTLLKDVPFYAHSLMWGDAYLALRNRNEQLEAAPDSSGYRCLWQWTSDLHAPKVIPALGRQLMRRALRVHPIAQAGTPLQSAGDPQISFLIGHRGMERVPHLLATLGSIAAQQGVRVECVVVEQDEVSQLGPVLPTWVRLVHAPPPDTNMPYCRSWSFNIAAQHAQATVLVLHDNDMLVPVDYASEILRRVAQGHDVVNLKRFIFYLTRAHTYDLFLKRAALLDVSPESIVQNLEGGGSIAITRAGYEQIGGMDESFIGWGGEDNEFWERAGTLRMWLWASLPLVHLHHLPQPGKEGAENGTIGRYRALSRLAPSERIRRLRAAPRGLRSGPTVTPTEVAP